MSRPVIYVSRITLTLGVLLLVVGTALAQSLPQVSIEQRTDRPGKDYKSFDVPSSDVRKCKEPCARDKNCKAYTFVKAGVQGRLARCYLKFGVPDARRSDCCISGVKQSVARYEFPFRYNARHFKKNEFIYWGRAEHNTCKKMVFELWPGLKESRCKGEKLGAKEQLFGYDLGSLRYEISALSRNNPNFPKWTEYGLSQGLDGSKNYHWHIYGKPVYAMQSGTVIACWRNAPENPKAKGEGEGYYHSEITKYPDYQSRIFGGGNHLWIKHDDGSVVEYAHFQPGTVPSSLCPHNAELLPGVIASTNTVDAWRYIRVTNGARVTQGQKLGEVGNSGTSSAPHLHIHREKGGSYGESYRAGSPVIIEFAEGIGANGAKLDYSKAPYQFSWSPLRNGLIPKGPSLVRPPN